MEDEKEDISFLFTNNPLTICNNSNQSLTSHSNHFYPSLHHLLFQSHSNLAQNQYLNVFHRFEDEKNENFGSGKVFDRIFCDSDETEAKKELNSVKSSSVNVFDRFDDKKGQHSVPGKVFHRFSYDSDENEAEKDINSVQSGSVKVFDRFSYSSDENEENQSQVPIKVFDGFFYDPEEEKSDENDTVNIAGKRLDNMIQYLDTKLLDKDEKKRKNRSSITRI